jgi:hypothetical protein
MIRWFLFNLNCLVTEQMGLLPFDEPDIRMPNCWDWAERNAWESHSNRAWWNSYMVTNYYPKVLEENAIPENERIPF